MNNDENNFLTTSTNFSIFLVMLNLFSTKQNTINSDTKNSVLEFVTK